jgi:hypothetical protein
MSTKSGEDQILAIAGLENIQKTSSILLSLTNVTVVAQMTKARGAIFLTTLLPRFN